MFPLTTVFHSNFFRQTTEHRRNPIRTNFKSRVKPSAVSCFLRNKVNRQSSPHELINHANGSRRARAIRPPAISSEPVGGTRTCSTTHPGHGPSFQISYAAKVIGRVFQQPVTVVKRYARIHGCYWRFCNNYPWNTLGSWLPCARYSVLLSIFIARPIDFPTRSSNNRVSPGNGAGFTHASHFPTLINPSIRGRLRLPPVLRCSSVTGNSVSAARVD